MKKYIITIVAALFGTVAANAQLYVHAGYNAATSTYTTIASSEKDPFGGVYVGGVYNYSLGSLLNGLGIEAGLDLDWNSETEKGSLSTEKWNEYALTVPVRLTYTLPLGTLDLKGMVGLLNSYELYNRSKYEFSNYTSEYDHLGEGDMKQFNMYSTVGLQAIFSGKYFIEASYYHQHGNESADASYTCKTDGFLFGLGLMF